MDGHQIGVDDPEAPRYWWRGANRYSTDPADHTPFNAAWLTAAARRGPGRALDLGAGEGADAIRLAKLGYAVDAVAVFSTATPVPAEHAAVPAFPDEEGGSVEQFYSGWQALLRSYERDRAEHSHPGFAPHAHSHIKLVAIRQPEGTRTR